MVNSLQCGVSAIISVAYCLCLENQCTGKYLNILPWYIAVFECVNCHVLVPGIVGSDYIMARLVD